MRLTITRVLSREVPVAWETMLRAISPMSTKHSYLSFRWLPARKVHPSGEVMDRGRWVLYENVPRSGIPSDIVRMLSDRPPRLLPKGQQQGRMLFVDDWAHEQFRVHRVWSRPFLVIQGDHGGTPISYDDTERELRRVKGLSTDAPKVGSLPYADFDMRTVRQIIQRDRLARVKGNIDALLRASTPEAMRAEAEEAQVQFRSDYLAWMEEESAASADFLTTYARTTASDMAMRKATRGEENAAAQLKDTFIATGIVPHAA